MRRFERGRREIASALPITSWASRGPIPTGLASVLEHLRALPAGVSEFMTHPGYFDEDLAYSRYGKQRETEVAGLTAPEARALIASEGIHLAHFGNLNG